MRRLRRRAPHAEKRNRSRDPRGRPRNYRGRSALSTFETLVFDLDGTLTDPYVGITRSYQFAREKLGLSLLPEGDLRGLIGPPMQQVFSVLSDGSAALVPSAIAAYRERYSTIGLFENVVYPGIPGALTSLAQSYRLFVCTSKPGTFATRILEHFDLSKYFDGIYGCELDGTRADKRELLQWLLEQEHVDGFAAAMIGDRKFDVAAALANGLTPYGVLWGHGTEAELQAAGARKCFSAAGDLCGEFPPAARTRP
jgi:phosphoglycolate phosphatase